MKRAGFTLIATLAVHDKQASDEQFLDLLPLITKGATDNRNYVKKAVNWALRQIGKRNIELNKKALTFAQTLKRQGSPPARWIATDAIRELASDKVQHVLIERKKKTLRKQKRA